MTVGGRLREDWSPEQIAGTDAVTISVERIYQHVAADRQRGGRCGNTCVGASDEGVIAAGHHGSASALAGGASMNILPWSHVAAVWATGRVTRSSARDRPGIVTLVDCKSGWTRLRKVPDGTATNVASAVLSVLHPVRAGVHTLTWDNGSEFAEHRLVDIALDATSYFAMPYSSWQRGCNENLNGLLRQYIPKGCDISHFTDAQIRQIEDKLNRRPGKRLGYQTPEQVFELSFKHVALRS